MTAEDIADFPSPEHARWSQNGLGTNDDENIYPMNLEKFMGITSFLHPSYHTRHENWRKWREVYDAGDNFVQGYTRRFSNRESARSWRRRKAMTPIPAFSTAAINEIRNSIFERLGDVTRKGGSQTYQRSISGSIGGVNLKGASMSWFIGHKILSELLVMQRVGVYVDSPDYGITLADKGSKHPYLYSYQAEDILNWTYSTDSDSEFSSVLLRDYIYITAEGSNLPVKETSRLRLIYLDQDSNVRVRFLLPNNEAKYNLNILNLDFPYESEITLPIKKIPFVMFEMTDSLMKNVANHQIALLNMESSDISYSIAANFPFYIEQYDPKNDSGRYLKQAQTAYNNVFNPDPGTQEVCPPQVQANEQADVGAAQGRKYPLGTDAPQFIHPSPEPLEVSMKKQSNLKDDIRMLVHLALSTVQSKAVSADSKKIDNQGLEAGLANIGIELEHGERKIAEYWDLYENANQIATIRYPERWSLKTSEEISKEVDQYRKLRDDIPSLTYKREMNKRIVEISLGPRVSIETLSKISNEIDNAKGASSDPKIIASDVEIGILGQQTANALRGYPEDEVAKAQADHAARLALISQAQSSGKALSNVAESDAVHALQNPAARGLPDLSVDPKTEASLEKVNKPGRGAGQGE